MAELVIGGWMPRHEGLKFVPVNARALDYQCALLPASTRGVNPTVVSEAATLEFRKATSGIQVFLKLPEGLNAATPPGPERTHLKAALARHVAAARALGARALVVPPTRCPYNGGKPSPHGVEKLLKDFYGLDWEEGDPQVLFQLDRVGVANPGFLAPVVRSIGSDLAGFALDPVTLRGTDEELGTLVEVFQGCWGDLTRAVVLTRTDFPVHALRALVAFGPVLFDLPSIVDQANLAEAVRASCGEP
jgi:hypothetical protein